MISVEPIASERLRNATYGTPALLTARRGTALTPPTGAMPGQTAESPTFVHTDCRATHSLTIIALLVSPACHVTTILPLNEP